MAQKAKKDLARVNTTTLKRLHTGTFLINALFLAVSVFLGHHSLIAYLLLSLPALIAEYVLETTGRPRYDPDTKVLRSSGEDLTAPGLIEYMFDVVWVTWISLVAVVVFGDWAWLVYSVIPVYGLYKGYSLLGTARGMMSGQQQGVQIPPDRSTGEVKKNKTPRS